ncbi:MAG: hypothetical protein MUF18_13070 [Fimbriiglobus sp.]|jgi:hypothetical protein|nr:hypothetical protein [Fimbriiglobus sp.]
MTRLLILAALFIPATASAVGIVPPFLPFDKPDTAVNTPSGDEDPLKTIDRITQNARAVGDRLQKEDSGAETQKTQDQLLRDIDSLLKPPPMNNNGGGGANQPPPMGGGGGSGNGGGANQPPPMGGGGGSRNQAKRPRGERKEEQRGGQNQEPMGSKQQDTKPESNGGKPVDESIEKDGDKEGKGGVGKGGNKNKPDLPLDDPFSRRVWGHLPEKLRQQALQSYREQFMPRYSEMLKQYYSTLNEKQSPNPMK